MNASTNTHGYKDAAMLAEKDLMAGYLHRLNTAQENGKKVCYTFVPGNLIELLHCFDVVPVFPEVLGLQMGMRRSSEHYIEMGERAGYSDDICSYVKSSVGMFMMDNVGPYGQPIPKPDFLFLVASQCFTFMKWWEILRKLFDCPIITIHLPYRHHNCMTADEAKYGLAQLTKVVIPQLEAATGIAFDIDQLRERLALSRQMEIDLAATLQAAAHTPSPIDAFSHALYYVGPINTYFRGTQEGVDFYRLARKTVEERVAANEGPMTPFGLLDEQKYRLVLECGITWDHFQEFNKILYDEKAVIVASTYTKVGGMYDSTEVLHDPSRPLESLIEHNMSNYCNNSLSDRVQLMEGYIRDYDADGFVVGSIKSCKSFSAGQLMMLQELERRTGMPGAFFECDMMDPRYFTEANVRTRLDSYFRMIDEKRRGV
ncbi:MAG: benzoyl-CoA reductase subunit B [Actinobacteria bacterium]|nr:benzoyl-CoA reductase subunit B [Actinomycetota bacterium]